MEKQSIIIAGAGIAGLVAACELAGKYDVTILEASGRAGGRIHSENPGVPDVMIERGAEFIHGELPETLRLAGEAGLTIIPVMGRMYRKANKRWLQDEDMIPHWDKLMDEMSQLPEDMTLSEFLDARFADARFQTLREQVIRYAEGFDLADPMKVSTRSLYEEWSHEDPQNYRIAEGYGALVKYFIGKCTQAGCKLLLNQAIEQVQWEPGHVTVITRSGQEFQADRLLVTVSVGVMQSRIKGSAIRFIPSIDQYTNAASNIGMGDVVRFVFVFSKPLWKKDTGFIFTEEAVPTWWTGIDATVPVLTGWVGGSRAAALAGNDDEALREIATASLASVFDRTIDEMKELVVFSSVNNWSTNPLTCGGYTYHTPGSTQALQVLNQPVADTVFFSGEGYYTGDHPGTVEAAIVSSLEVSRNIIEASPV